MVSKRVPLTTSTIMLNNHGFFGVVEHREAHVDP